MIRSIWADNYKSLRNLNLELTHLNVLVGANGSGKSNIVDLLRFLRDSLMYSNGLIGAIESRGGWNAINTYHSEDTEIRIGLSAVMSDEQRDTYLSLLPDDSHLIDGDIAYQIRIRPGENYVSVVHEVLGQRDKNGNWVNVICSRDLTGGYYRTGRLLDSENRIVLESIPPGRSIVTVADSALWRIYHPIFSWQFLNLYPEAARQDAYGKGDFFLRSLEENGENLAGLLKSLDADSAAAVNEAMQRDVPGFLQFKLEEAGGRILLTVDEEHAKGLPPVSISDGTIRLLAFFALYYRESRPPLLCFEEPENGLHPTLTETVVEYLHAMNQTTQVVVTTHSPQLVDQCRPDEVILLEKIDGATRAMRVPSRAQIDQFLEDFSLGGLWTRGFLDEIVHNGVGSHSPG